jgi:ribose/xylose/arabinose/galactoside ABC-type transport system permease subunit
MVIQRHHHIQYNQRSASQKVCLIVGFFLILLGLIGTVIPEAMNMHLSSAHNIIHLVTGILGMWIGSMDDPKRANAFCVTIGFLYTAIGVAGFIIGVPGYPSGNMPGMKGDQYLFKAIPNVLELGSMDHTIHLILGAFFLFSSIPSKKSPNL